MPESGDIAAARRTVDADDVDLFVLIRFLWMSRVYILVGALLVAGASFAFSTFATKWYRVSAVYTPRTVGNSNSLDSLSQRVGSLAALAGVNLSASVPPAQHHADIFNSGQFLIRYAEQTDMKAKLFADQWLPERKQWINSKGKPVSDEEVLKAVRDVLYVDYDSVRMQLQVTAEWKDPVVAVRWANGVVPFGNAFIRKRELETANYNILFLRRELGDARYPYMQQALADLLTTQVERRMLTLNSPEYAFVLLDPARMPIFHAFPRRLLFTVFGGVIGGIIGAMAAFGVRQYRREQARRT